MKALAALLITFTLSVCVVADNIPGSFVTEKDQSTLYASLQNTLKKADSNGIIKTWVFFTDKGFSSLSEYNTRIRETENNLTERARNRRLKARGPENVVSFYDLPVYQPYVDQVASTGVKIRAILRWFNAVTIEASAEQLSEIAELPFVRKFKSISIAWYPDNYTKEVSLTPEYPLTSTSLNYGVSLSQLEQVNTVVAHEIGFAGQGVLVCMMDTGYRQGHIAFYDAINEGRLIAQYDFINDDYNTDYDSTQDVENQPRHGTITWSTLGGQSATNLYGPAFRSMFCLAKTEDVTGEHHIEEDYWAEGAQWADSLGADVISASLGYRYRFDYPDPDYTYADMNGDSTIVTQAADLAVYNGITVVTAQGNDGDQGAGSLIAPADGDSVIAVGAVDESDAIADFSGLGPTYDGRIKPEVCARGVFTVCADPSNMYGFTWTNGTSLSTPLAGGVSAVLLSVHPNWTPMMIREALMMTASRNAAPDNTYGSGIIDIGKAMFYHPQGDIIIEHEPLIYFPSGLDNNAVYATITGGAGINSARVFLYWRTDENESFQSTQMITGDNVHYEGIVPGLDEGYLQYYIYAEDINGIYATYPYGTPDNYFMVYIDSTVFQDSFEKGLYYWKNAATSGQFAITAERAAAGNISLADSPYRFYENNSELILASNFAVPLYDNTLSAQVIFKARYFLEPQSDSVYLEISTDEGASWQILGEPINGYNSTFGEITNDLSAYIGNRIRFRFRMVTDNAGTRDGIHIDDFKVIWDTQVGIADNETSIPYRFSLKQNYPNPFNASTKISFSLANAGIARLSIYDILGREVRTLINGELPAGSHDIIWNGKDNSGKDAASGIYLYKLETGDKKSTKRMILLR